MVETRISKRPSRTPARRSRAPGTRRSSAAPLKPADVRAFGRAMDLLVRAIRVRSPNVDPTAQRAFALWRDLRLAPLEVDATDLRLRGASALSPEHELRWLLPAFMAGLRKASPRAELTEAELRNLAEALARLDPDVASIEAFRDWAWSGAATGFELDLQSSFMEALDDVAQEMDVDVNAVVEEMRAAALAATAGRAVLLSARALAKAAGRDELDLPLGSPETHADDSPLALPAQVSDALRSSCDDAARWLLAEVRLVMRQPALQDTVRADRFAKRLRDALRGDAPGDALDVMEDLARRARHSDAFAGELVAALDDPSFGAEIAAALWSSPAAARRGMEVLLALGPKAAHAAAGGLLDAAARDPAWARALAELVQSAGGRLDALLLGRDEVPGAAAVTALLDAFGERGLRALWSRATAEPQGWLGRPFATVCRAALDAGLGEALLVPFVRDRGADLTLRLEALDVLGAHPALLARAVAWRMGELLEAPALRERLKALRSAP